MVWVLFENTFDDVFWNDVVEKIFPQESQFEFMSNAENDSHIVKSDVLIVNLKVWNVLQFLQYIFVFHLKVAFDKLNAFLAMFSCHSFPENWFIYHLLDFHP